MFHYLRQRFTGRATNKKKESPLEYTHSILSSKIAGNPTYQREPYHNDNNIFLEATFSKGYWGSENRPETTRENWQQPKTGIGGPFRVNNGYGLESSKKNSPRATRFVKNKSNPFSRDNHPGTSKNVD